MTVRTRFAPSPSGLLHIGGVRTALFCWLFARHHHGEFILRIEDTDRARSTDAAVNVILEGMAWLGLKADEGPFYQSERTQRYEAVIQQLLEEGKAYYCYCSKDELDVMRAEAIARGEKPKYNGKCRHADTASASHDKPVVRFKNPDDGEVIVEDYMSLCHRNGQ